MSMDYLTSFGDPVRGDPEHIIFSSQAYKSELLTPAPLKLCVGRAGFEPAKV
jgi:hypothetical protein